jgi:hypothetical protein
MSKVTFYGLPAWVGAIHGPTICQWWRHDPAQLSWDRALLATVDLARTPSAALAGHIQVSEIEVDDHVGRGGRTTIGPLWPGGTAIGACWVSDQYLARTGVSAQATVPPGATGHGHEYMMIHYFDGEHGNRRFHGFHARLLQQHGQLSLVELWHPGTGAGPAQPAGSWWLDLGASADPGTPPLATNQPAPVFLDASTVGGIKMINPKLPPYLGAFPLAA